jgi:hypothetical protein
LGEGQDDPACGRAGRLLRFCLAQVRFPDNAEKIGFSTFPRVTDEMLTYLNRHGAQGILDRASNAQLDSEFETHNIEEVAKIILEKGQVIQNKVGPLYQYTRLE